MIDFVVRLISDLFILLKVDFVLKIIIAGVCFLWPCCGRVDTVEVLIVVDALGDLGSALGP